MTTFPLLAFNLGGPEVAIIFVLMLLLFGAKKLPELARGMGKSLGEFKKAKQEFEDEIKYGDLNARDDKPAPKKAKQEFEDEIKYGDLHANEDKPAPTTPVVSEAAGKQQFPG